jgi:uncharacterized membrane protein
MWQTAAELHATLNDLPATLLVLSVLFDLAGSATKREALSTVGFWMLVAGAVGAVLALLSGLAAERSIEHGGAVHLVMERHETLAITATVLFGGLAAWRIWRRGQLGPKERPTYLTIAAVGALLVFWVGHVGGTIVYRYGGGIPTPVMEGALADRQAGHSHAEGADHDHEGGSMPGDSTAVDSTAVDSTAADHEHAPGTPEHEH